MRVRFGTLLSTVVIGAVGFITLVGLLIGPQFEPLWTVTNALNFPFFAQLFLQIAVLIIALTILLGLVNLLVVHVTRLRRGEGAFLNRLNSLVLLIVFTGTVLVYLIERANSTPNATSTTRVLLDNVQVALESSLAALLFFSLVYGASRILRVELSFPRLLFVAMIVVVLLASLPLSALALLTPVYDWLLSVPVNAGARGLLIGIGLATALTGLRVLVGQDKTYH